MIEVLVILFIIGVLIKPTGEYIARVMMGKPVILSRLFGRVEQEMLRVMHVSPADEMNWREYAYAMLVFHFFCFAFLYALLLMQGMLPLNPRGFEGLSPDLAFNVAMSFITDTNWQSYSGERQLSYFSQTVGLTVQNFMAPASAIGVAMVMCRGLRRKQTSRIGNFWVDMVRVVLYFLIPLSLIWSVLLMSQGVVQTFSDYVTLTTLEGREQVIALGPAASQIAIKMAGANGGGFFGVNAAHPFSNPTGFSNALEMIAMLLFPASFLYAFGAMVGDRRQGLVLLVAVLLFYIPLLFLTILEEQKPYPGLPEGTVSDMGNIEGKEMRIGSSASAFWTVSTTSTSNGSVNSSIIGHRPLASFVPLLLTQITGGKFAGLGLGLCCMLIFVIISVFIGSLMAGRTPEYLGKKLDTFEVKMASIVILVPTFFTLVGTTIAILTPSALVDMDDPGIQAYIDILYAFSSAASNNGSAYGGFNSDTPFYNTLLGICIFAGRFFFCIPMLAIGGSLAERNIVPTTAGTMSTHTPLFCLLLFMAILLIDIMTYIPGLWIGPVVEHLHLMIDFPKPGAVP